MENAARAEVMRAFEAAATPLLVLGPEAEVFAANAAGRGMLRHAGAIALEGSVLRPRRKADRAALERALATLASGGLEAETVRLVSRSGTPALLLVLRALPDEPLRLLAALVDLREPPQPDAAWVARAFRLTRAEARIAALLAAGTEPDAIPERLGMGAERARGLLALALEKTGARSQAQLALMVCRAFAALSVPGAEPRG
jgi:DNA-binding CsgD family transcriptional regulator